MNDGFTGIALILLIASSRVPSALGLAGLSNPTWLSLICRKVRPPASCALASSMMPRERGTPPEMVHRTPVPAQVMHSRTLRRLRFFALGSLVLDVIGRSPLKNGHLRTSRSEQPPFYSRSRIGI